MSAGATPGFNKKFNLNSNILGAGSATSIELGAATDGDVLDAVVNNKRFPARRIDLARISLQTEAGKDIKFDSGKGAVSFSASASARSALGVFDKGADVIQSLALEDADEVGLALSDAEGVRYLLFLWGYGIEAGVQGSHPIGVLGSVKFGVDGKRESLFAVVHRFASNDGARDVIQSTVSSWRLPRQVSSADELKPGTMLIAETEGSIAIKIAAQLGYDFSFVRDAKALGLTGDIGLKLETGVKATLGLEASGRYLVALDREAMDAAFQSLRLRLFKLSKKGWNFGLNLSASVTGVVDALPSQVDDLVKAVFGVHGLQVVKDLKAIERWTDPQSDLSDTVAGLINKTGLDLLQETTGIDAREKFNEARGIVLRALQKWDELPDKVSAALWSLLGDVGVEGAARTKFESFLKVLAAPDDAARKRELSGALQAVGFADLPAGRWLTAVAERGLLALLDRTDELTPIARTTLSILDGGVIAKLQQFVNERLNLDKVRHAVTKADFDQIDGWLVKRLSAFLDDELGFEKLDQIKDAINLVIRKRQEIYAKARQALARRYDFDFAYSYQKTTTRTALLDVNFDTSQAGARDMLRAVLAESDFDKLLIEKTGGVTLNQAALTHEISSRASVQVTMPFYSSRTDTINTSLAKVRAEEDGGRVLFYELDATDTVAVQNRMKSQLSVAAAMPFAAGGAVRTHSTDSMTWSYRYLQARQNMRREDLEYQIRPYILQYLPEPFEQGGKSSLGTWITDLDRQVEEVVHNGTNEFGDVLLAMELSVPAQVLDAWFQPRTDEQLKNAAMEMSRRLQAKLKELLPFYYFQDIDNVQQNAAAAPLLAYAAIPPSTSVLLDNGKLTFNTDQDAYWNWPDKDLRKAMVFNGVTQDRLSRLIAGAHDRLVEAGKKKDAAFFAPQEISDFQSLATEGHGGANLQSLLFVEAQIVRGCEKALRDIGAFREAQGVNPSKAIERLAEFGRDITKTFNEKIRSVYGGGALRPLGSMIFMEASCALDGDLRSARPAALLSLTVLKEQRNFQIGDFLKNQIPSKDDVAVEQRLLSQGDVA